MHGKSNNLYKNYSSMPYIQDSLTTIEVKLGL